MTGLVNLNKARKAKAKADREAKAAENRVRFGRPKADRKLEAAKADMADRRLKDHKLDSDR